MPRSTSPAVPQTYAALRAAVEQTMIRGQLEADLARVRTYHETGRLIREHLRLTGDKPEYGSQIMHGLAADLKLSDTVLYRCVRFTECFPILATWPNLTWAHYRTLIPVSDPKLRQSLAVEADRNVWPVVQLEQRIRILLPPEPTGGGEIDLVGAPPKLMTLKRGTPGVCKVISVDGAPVVDLGFATYLDLPEDTEFRAGAFVRVTKANISPEPAATKADECHGLHHQA